MREQLRRRAWSFSSLKRFFTCPYGFILEEIQNLAPPPCFEEEEHANLLIGNFLHRFFAELKDRPPAVEKWRERFDECWESDRDLQAKLPDQAVRKAIVRSHLADIAAWERETGRPLLFSDEVTAAELELTAPFGGGRYRLKGRIDRLQRQGEKLLIADLKYKETQKVLRPGSAGRPAGSKPTPSTTASSFSSTPIWPCIMKRRRPASSMRPISSSGRGCGATMRAGSRRRIWPPATRRWSGSPSGSTGCWPWSASNPTTAPRAAPIAPTRRSASSPISIVRVGGQEAVHDEESLRHRLGRLGEDLPPDPGGAPPSRPGGGVRRRRHLHQRRGGGDGKTDPRSDREGGGERRRQACGSSCGPTGSIFRPSMRSSTGSSRRRPMCPRWPTITSRRSSPPAPMSASSSIRGSSPTSKAS